MYEKDLLTKAIEYGILPLDIVPNIENMIKKREVLKVHQAAVYQGKDSRWYTYVADDSHKYKRRKVVKRSEQELYNYLYDIYKGNIESALPTIKSIYPLWKNYKLALCNRTNTVYRIDLDWKKYYLDESLSQDLISKPIEKVTRADIKMWAHQIIKKYNMTRKQYMNIQTILKQMFQFLIDNQTLDRDPTEHLKIDSSLFRKTSKKSAESQIFYQDEIDQIVEHCKKMADETDDETWLAIPLFFLTGMRIGEILALGHEDFDKNSSTVFIHRSLCMNVELKEDGSWSQRKYQIEEHLKKNAEPRKILVPKQVFDLEKQIRIIQLKKGSLDSFLFHVKTPHTVTGKLYRLCDELGIRRRSPHKCRKTYISNLLNKGMDADFVREQAGHRDLQTTLNCYAYSTTRDEEKVAKLEEILAI